MIRDASPRRGGERGHWGRVRERRRGGGCGGGRGSSSRPSRHRPTGPGERVEFAFSSFRAVQVPVVSDRLLLSIVSVDTGRTIAKSSKAAARNGICQWPDSIREPIWLPQDEASKEFEDCQCKIIVSMGSTRTAILGEVILNLTNYLSSVDSTSISLPLKKCNSGTVLQLKIHCLGTKSKSSVVKQSNERSPRLDGHSPTNDDVDSKSDGFDATSSRRPHSSSRNHLDVHKDDIGNRDARFSGAGSHDTTDRTNLSPRDDADGGLYMGSSEIPGQNMQHQSIAHLSSGASGSSKNLLDAAEETIEELLNEAQMWETHSRKLKNDLETLQKVCDEKSSKQTELLLELSASQAEVDSLRQEIEELKLSVEAVAAQQTIQGTPKSGTVVHVQHELKDEVQFLQESNENLTTQLKKTQDANIELVSILQELEETVEAQREEISTFSQASTVIDHEVSKNSLPVQEDAQWAIKLSLKDDEITALREKLDRILNIENAGGVGSGAVYLELEKENDFLKSQIEELEKDCSELTEENLGLIYKLKEVSGVEGQDSCDLSGLSLSGVKYLQKKCADLELKILNFRSESTKLEEKLQKIQDELKEKTLELSDLRENLSSFHATGGNQLRSEELGGTESELKLLKDRVQLKEKEIEGLQHSNHEMESFISEIKKEKSRLEEHLAASLEESGITLKCLDEVQQDILELTSEIDSHVSTNMVLERNKSDLESCKIKQELHISNLETEKIELSVSISRLQTRLTNLTSEKEASIVKIQQQQSEMEAQKLELKQKQLEFQRRLSEVQEGSESVRRSNTKLQATVDNLVEECRSLQTLTAELKKQKLELHVCATQLEQELEQSKRKTIEFCRTVEFLEAKLSSIQKDISSKEHSFLSELESIFQEHKEHEEKINHAHFQLNKIEKEKIIEVEILEREVMSLTEQLSSAHEGREGATLDTIREASTLRADKAKLEASLHGLNEELRHYEVQLEDVRKESKSKIKSLVDSLNESKQNEEIMKTDVEHMRRLMEDAKSNEENLRKTSDELEVKFKSSDYEKQQIMEEISGLKIQVQKIAGLQDELLKLQSSLDEAKYENKKLEELMQLLSEECEELKVQKAMLTDKVSRIKDTSNNTDEEKQSKITMQAKHNSVKQGNNDLATDNGGCSPVNEEPDLQTKIQSLESRLGKALEENSMYKTQLRSSMPEGSSDGRGGKENNDDKVAQLESELNDMQDRLLNMSMQYAEVEAQREELVMELKNVNVNSKKGGRWF